MRLRYICCNNYNSHGRDNFKYCLSGTKYPNQYIDELWNGKIVNRQQIINEYKFANCIFVIYLNYHKDMIQKDTLSIFRRLVVNTSVLFTLQFMFKSGVNVSNFIECNYAALSDMISRLCMISSFILAPRYNTREHILAMLNKTIDILKKHEAEKSTVLEYQETTVYEKKTGQEELLQQHREFISGSVDKAFPAEKLETIMEECSEQQLPLELQQSLAVGDAFGDYGQLNYVLQEGKFHLKANPGEVLLVDVWATWCGPCQGPMQHNQDMLVKNKQQWTGKVNIVGVSVDDNKDSVIKRVETKKWTDITHLTLGGWDGEHALVKDFSISGIPFVCLVDKFGKIDYIGHPSQGNLEVRINELIAKAPEPVKQAAGAQEIPVSLEDIEKVRNIVSADGIKKAFQTADLGLVKIAYKAKFNKGSINSTIEVDLYVYEDQQQGIQTIKNEIAALGLQNVAKITAHSIKYVEVPQIQNPNCWQCAAHLTFPYYWLKWEEGAKFGCRNCIQASSNIPDHHYKYEKNSVLLNGPVKRIALKGLGQNIQPQNIQDVKGRHSFSCNGCGGGSNEIGEARYICLGCRNDPNPRGDYVDVCSACFVKLFSGDEQVAQNLESDNYKKDYPFLRVLYNIHGYYKY